MFSAFRSPFGAVFGGALAADFHPADIAGLTLGLMTDAGTYQASGGAAAAADGDPLGYWLDQSASGYHVSQTTTTAKPTYRTSGPNGKPCVQFATNDYLQRLSVPSLSLVAANAATIYLILKEGASQAAHPIFFLSTDDSATEAFSAGTPTDGTKKITYSHGSFSNGVGTATVVVPSGWNNNWHCLRLQRNGATATIRADGTTLATVTTLSDNLNSLTRTLFLGTAFGWFYNGFLAEILVYNRALTSGENDQVAAYLLSKYGLVV